MALNDRLELNFNMSLTQRESALSFEEAFRYATIYNPTAPVTFDNGNYWQAILFDNFNPVEIAENNQSDAKDKLLNYSLVASFQVLDGLSFNTNFAKQSVNQLSGQYNPSTSFFRGLSRGGRATRRIADNEMTRFESYLIFQPEKSKYNWSITSGFSYQQYFNESLFMEMGNLPTDALGYYGIDLSADRVSGGERSIIIDAQASPKEKVAGYFVQTQITLDEGLDISASFRRDGSSRLGSNNQWANYYALGANIDVLTYIKFKPFSKMNLRLDHGLTGMLPHIYGLSQSQYAYDFSGGGQVSQTYLSNHDLKAEKKLSTNVGLDLSLLNGRVNFSAERFWHFTSISSMKK